MCRRQIWAEMKALCQRAGVFPHNLRPLCAAADDRAYKDIAKLTDVLGHSSIETTRMDLISTETEHEKSWKQLRLGSLGQNKKFVLNRTSLPLGFIFFIYILSLIFCLHQSSRRHISRLKRFFSRLDVLWPLWGGFSYLLRTIQKKLEFSNSTLKNHLTNCLFCV